MTAGAGAEAAAVGDAKGSSRRAPLAVDRAAIEVKRVFRGGAAGAALSAPAFGASAIVVRASATDRIERVSAVASCGFGGGALTHWSSTSGFAGPGEPRRLRIGSGADNALTHFGWTGNFVLLAAAGAEAFSKACLACVPRVFADRPSLGAGAFAESVGETPMDASGLAAFVRSVAIFRGMFGMKRSQWTPGKDPVPFLS
ncbi:MAG TPA: hypothetical protein VFE63_21425 [Roseiarcus sp.]|nr:hypothetical protein [Roseiarcus sp.]